MKLGDCDVMQKRKAVFQEEMPVERESLTKPENNSLVLARPWMLMSLAKLSGIVESLQESKS